MFSQLLTAIRNYSKRQLTWFKRETDFMPLALAPDESGATTAARIVTALPDVTRS